MFGRVTRGLVARAVLVLIASLALTAVVAACGEEAARQQEEVVVVAGTGYLADIVRNVAGDRLEVESLIPEGADPHVFQPTPGEAARLAESRVVVIDTRGLMPLVDEMIAGTERPGRLVVEAALGIEPRQGGGSHEPSGHGHEQHDHAQDQHDHGHGGLDPHFWLDPIHVLTYVENIREALASVDPEGASAYRANAEAYQGRLRELDGWIREQVAIIPAERRLLVTNHESLGYFADRYGFRVVGTVFPTVASAGSPSARQLVELIETIKAEGASAIFLETGGAGDVAEQVAREAGIKVVSDLHTHSLGGEVSTYIEMMKWNVRLIVEALR